MAPLRMTPHAAAQLLGLEPGASTVDVNNAWRAWVKLAHPDAGGDRAHFEALAEARSVLLRESRWASSRAVAPSVRPTLGSVCRRPGPRALLGYIVVVVAVPLSVFVAPHLSDVVAGFLLGIVAAAGAMTVARTVLRPSADTGHRITVLVMSWFPIVTLLVGGAHVVGAEVIGVLPVIALPFIACIASVNPGAGLWRPVGSSS